MYRLNSFKRTVVGIFCLLSLLVPFTAGAQTQGARIRSFNDIFPGIGEELKSEVFGESGLVRSHKKNKALELLPATSSGIDLKSEVMKTSPSYLAESILVVPYSGNAYTTLDAYNALSKIRDLKGRLYNSHTRGAAVPLFEDASRVESEKKYSTTIRDPEPALSLPASETVYMRLKDINFGNTYYKGVLSTSAYGITYNLSNFRTITYTVFTVMKEQKFSAILYMEPLTEGMLIYSVAGADASDFIAGKIDIPSAISKRLAVFIGWINDGIKSI